MSTTERLLKIVLRASGVVCCLAVAAALMPRSWMAYAHDWLGMGTFPAKPVAEYLARSTSGLWTFMGVLFLVVAADVRRYARVITVQVLAIGLLSVLGMIYGGMPLYWLVADLVTAVGLCVVTLILQANLAVGDKGRGR